MLYLSYGMPKSASSFCFQLTLDVAKQYMAEKGLKFGKVTRIWPQSRYGLYFAPSPEIDLDHFVELALDQIHKDFFFVVKLHCSCTPFVKKKIAVGEIMASATFRHPADCILSYMDASAREIDRETNRFPEGDSFESALKTYKGVARAFLDWAHIYGINLISFNELAVSPQTVIAKIARQFGVQADSQKIMEPYLSNVNSINEFNKGIIDRRYQELTLNELEVIEQKYPELIKFINSYEKND